MKGIRFEVGGTGMFHATDLLDEIEDNMLEQEYQDYHYATDAFEFNLTVPEILAPGNHVRTVSFFTEEGMKAFEDCIDIYYNLFADYVEGAGLGDIKEFTVEIPDDLIVWQDENQFLIKEEDFNRDLYVVRQEPDECAFTATKL